jgi:hypothetical protein
VSSRAGALGVAHTKGDLYVMDANGRLARLPAGANGRKLVARDSDPLGVAWEAELRSIEMPPETSATITGFFGRRPGQSSVGGTLFGCCVVPPDFGTFVRYEAWIIPRSNQAARSFTLDTQVGLDGGALIAQTGTETIVTDVVTATHRRLQFPNAQPTGGLAPGDLTGLRFTNVDASTIDGIRFLLYYLTP